MINAFVLFIIGVMCAYIGHKLLIQAGDVTGGLEAAIVFAFMLAGAMFLFAYNSFERGRFK